MLGPLDGARFGTSVATAFAPLPGLKDRLGRVQVPDRSLGLAGRVRALRGMGTALVVGP